MYKKFIRKYNKIYKKIQSIPNDIYELDKIIRNIENLNRKLIDHNITSIMRSKDCLIDSLFSIKLEVNKDE